MTTTYTVLPRGARLPAPRPLGPLTPLGTTTNRPTYVRPVTDPGGVTRPEVWEATSADGLWRYVRNDDDGTTWTIELIPTGQTMLTGRLDDARRQTAGGLLARFRTAAYAAAWGPIVERGEGQRLLAIHMRLAGLGLGDDADARCVCGGVIAVVTSTGRLGHLDVCAECYTYGQGMIGQPCPDPARHRFCGLPEPAECGHRPYNRCAEVALPTGGDRCGGSGDVDCCLTCCRE